MNERETRQEQLTIKPNVLIEVWNTRSGAYTRQRRRNLITTIGVAVVGELLLRGVRGTSTGFAPSHIALGSGTTAAVIGDATLEAESYRDIVTVRRGSGAGATYASTFQLFLDTGDGNGSTFTEAGLFDSPTIGGGALFSRILFTSVEKTPSIQLAITWDINLEGN